MRFTSLIVELIRARPRLTVSVVLLVQAAIWFVIPTLFYNSPPGRLATVIAVGREYQVGTDLGPPLAFWLADLAYRAAGQHMAGVYLLSQLCFISTFWLLFILGRSMVGAPQAVIAVLLTMAITVFGWTGIEFGPHILARPVWAWTLLQCWRVIGQNRRTAWFGLAIASGILVLTTSDAPWLLLLLAVFILAIARGQRRLMSLDPLYAVLITIALAVPWLTWLHRTGSLASPLPTLATPLRNIGLETTLDAGIRMVSSLAYLLIATSGIVLLAVLNAGRFARRRESAPVILRNATDPLAKAFVYTFALAPPVAGSLIAAVTGREQVVGGAGVALLMVGLAVVVGTGEIIPLRQQRMLRKVWALVIIAPAVTALVNLLVVPWLTRTSFATATPASDVARFFGDNFQRRTGLALRAVAGDADLAALVSLGSTRPHLLIDAAPQRTPWMSRAQFDRIGGVVVWHATDTLGTPPADLSQRFPNLVPEVPEAFESLLSGRQTATRIGWGIVRPGT